MHPSETRQEDERQKRLETVETRRVEQGERGVIQATWDFDVTDETTAHVSRSVYSCFMSLS